MHSMFNRMKYNFNKFNISLKFDNVDMFIANLKKQVYNVESFPFALYIFFSVGLMSIFAYRHFESIIN